jgi:tRNA threonylcarbamoyladenosine biosynthesis protein TsaE
MKPVVIESLDSINEAAKEVLCQIGDNRIVCFYGEMGSGKTTLIKALCQEMGCTDTVVSPTFALINEYNTSQGKPIFHFDFYRINKLEEVFDFGYEEYFYTARDGVCLIEWPELVETILPEQRVLRFKITVRDDGAREVRIIDNDSMSLS